MRINDDLDPILNNLSN